MSRIRSGNDMIQLKRVYEKPSRKDGIRILVDRLWPRGLTKERAAVNLWLKDVARAANCASGSVTIRPNGRSFRYVTGRNFDEKKDALKLLKQKSEERTVTLVYGARDEQHNEAVVLRKIVEGRKRWS